jgi:hypothetical protein
MENPKDPKINVGFRGFTERKGLLTTFVIPYGRTSKTVKIHIRAERLRVYGLFNCLSAFESKLSTPPGN